ncbi:MAG TPA: hypothetical protein PKV71_05275 [Calditrichia bacterium]|nr:hypothetical protein [Calditrichota bacterium]HQU71009.1 hypothetical protein [Calditrichia bacterium]HQV31264.1 hypothetical protein [Calditrichia bacterium]
MAEKSKPDILPDMVFKLSHKRSPSEVKLRSLEWAIVTQLDGVKSVGQIGEILALSWEETRAMFRRLKEEGLLVMLDASAPVQRDIPKGLLEKVEYEFTLHLGPVASVILEDILTELKRTRDTLEPGQVPLLVELISLEISHPEHRYKFEKSMLETIKAIV